LERSGLVVRAVSRFGYPARVGTTRLGWVGAGAGLLAALALLAPWAGSGSTNRSSIELLTSAGVLDVISGWQKPAAMLAWYVVVVLAAIAVVSIAWGRATVGAVAMLPIGPAMMVSAAIVAHSSLPLRWGALAGVASGLTATVAAVLILMRDPSSGKEAAQ